MKMKKILAALLATAMCVSSFAGCSSSSDDTSSSSDDTSSSSSSSSEADVDADEVEVDGINVLEDEGVITFLYRGDETDGWDEVNAEFVNQTYDTLKTELDVTFVPTADYKDKLNLEITSGAEYDLVFEASWIHLATLSSEGYYADLSYYFGNEDYAGLYETYSMDVMEANVWYDYMCFIPIYRYFGNAISCYYYRQDWADEWGFGEIESWDELVEYWEYAEENTDVYAISGSGGCFNGLFTSDGVYDGTEASNDLSTAQAGMNKYNIGSATGGVDLWVYVEDNELISIAVEGSGDEAFADFPEGWDYDFSTAISYQTYADLYDSGYVSPDVLSLSDSKTPFVSGLAASWKGTLDTYDTTYNDFVAYCTDEGAELGYYILSDSMRNMEEETVGTTYIANNGLAIPANSDEIDRTMAFLNWLNSSAENHYLFELGIEGEDWEAVGENQYEALSDYASSFPGYSLTWSPIYTKYSTVMTDEVIEYNIYNSLSTTYVELVGSGFTFDYSSTEMSNLVAQITGISGNYYAMYAGILTDGVNTYDTSAEMRLAMYEEVMDAGLQTVLDEFETQFVAFLAG